jgi:hypothetical protein
MVFLGSSGITLQQATTSFFHVIPIYHLKQHSHLIPYNQNSELWVLNELTKQAVIVAAL